MAKHYVGMVGAFLGALVGGWLMLAPSVLAYQPEGSDWTDATMTSFWSGLVLVAVSGVGVAVYSVGLVELLRERGVLRRPVYEEPQRGGPVSAGGGDTGQDSLQQTLAPLVAAMVEDMQSRGEKPPAEGGVASGGPQHNNARSQDRGHGDRANGDRGPAHEPDPSQSSARQDRENH